MGMLLQKDHAEIHRTGLLERVSRGPRIMLFIFPPGYGDDLFIQSLRDEISGLRDWPGALDTSGTQESPLVWFLDLRGDNDSVTDKLEEAFRQIAEGKDRLLVALSPNEGKLAKAALPKGSDWEVIDEDRLAYEADEVRQLLSLKFSSGVTQDLVSEVVEVTGGWPILLDCLLSNAGAVELLRGRLQSQEILEDVVALLQTQWTRLTSLSLGEAMVFGIVRHFDLHILAHLLGSREKASAVLHQLQESGLVTHESMGRMRHPLLRDAIEHVSLARWPRKVLTFHKMAATFFSKHAPSERAPDVVAHFLAAGEFQAAIVHTERHGDRLVDRVSSKRLWEWLSTMERSAGPLPLRSSALFAQVKAARGDWSGAKASLGQCEQLLKSPKLTTSERTLGYARIAGVQAHMAWLRGITNEANTFSQRAMAAVEQAARTGPLKDKDSVAALQLDLLELRATLLLDAGRYLRARETLSQVVILAQAHGQGDALLSARKDLGILAMREGQLREAMQRYEECIPGLNRRAQPELYSSLYSNMANCLRLQGHYDRAIQAATSALSVRRFVSLETSSYALFVSAQIQQAAEIWEEAQDLFEAAFEGAEQTGNGVLRASVRVWYAAFMTRKGKNDEATALLDEIPRFIGNLERSYPMLWGLAETVLGHQKLNDGDHREAIAHYTRSLSSFQKLKAPFYEGTSFLNIAHAHYQRKAAGELSDASRIRSFSEKACRIANTHGYRFGENERHGPVLALAASTGSVETSHYIGCLKGNFEDKPGPVSVPVPEESQEMGTRLVSQEGSRQIHPSEVATLLESINPEILNVIILNGKTEILHKGKRQTGDLKRIILPLMRMLLAHAGSEVKAPVLAAHVWGDTPYDQKARTRLKVAISRLRTLLGEDSKHLTTIPGRGPNRAENTGYRIEKQLQFLWLECQ